MVPYPKTVDMIYVDRRVPVSWEELIRYSTILMRYGFDWMDWWRTMGLAN